MKTLSAMGDIFFRLENTGSCAARKWACHHLVTGIQSSVDQEATKRWVDVAGIRRISALKHPDATLSPKLEIKNAGLQIMGSWQKVHIPKAKSIEPRMGFCSFVWMSACSH